MAATRRQLFALYADTGKCLELRNLGEALSFDDASRMISALRNKGVSPDTIKQELLGLGATEKNVGNIATIERQVKTDFQAIYNEADKAGREAAEKHKPTPMVVSQHANQLDDNSEVVQQWVVPAGVCGFAWIWFKGNTAWAKWAAKKNLSSDAYPSGKRIWVSLYNQSMELKEAYASAFAKVLQSHGITAYAQSRMD